MVNWRKQLVPAIAATSLLLVSGTPANAVSQADASVETAVLIPGATVFKQINPLYPIVAATYPNIGLHFHDKDAELRLVDYSQEALASDMAIRDGVKQADIVVRQVDGKVVIIGESMGSMVAARLAAELASSDDPPSTKDVSFVLIAPPEGGVAEYFKEGTFIPILNYTVSRIAESPYATTIVTGEYDGWADPPDRPWNLLSSANALLGIVYVHGPPIFSTDPAAVPAGNTTFIPANAQHGSITTIFVPTKNLPLTQVFRDIGVPGALVDEVDQVLRPIIDAGYVRNDKPGDTRPYLHDGEIRSNLQNQQQIRAPRRERSEKRLDSGQERRSELPQAMRKDLRDRVEAGARPLKNRIAERKNNKDKSTGKEKAGKEKVVRVSS